MNIINEKEFRNHLIILIILFFFYMVIVIFNKEKILELLNSFFDARYNIYSKAFFGSVFFPFLITASIFFALLQNYRGKIRSFFFDEKGLSIYTNTVTIIFNNQIVRISFIGKDEYIEEIIFITSKNKYFIYHPEEKFIRNTFDYYNLKKETKIDYDQNSKKIKRHYEINKNFPLTRVLQ